MATTAITGRIFLALGAFLTTSLYHLGNTKVEHHHHHHEDRHDQDHHHHHNNHKLTAAAPLRRTKEAEKDRITHLPGLDRFKQQLSFEQFSGYLDAAETRHVFYWYVESESNPNEDPVGTYIYTPTCSRPTNTTTTTTFLFLSLLAPNWALSTCIRIYALLPQIPVLTRTIFFSMFFLGNNSAVDKWGSWLFGVVGFWGGARYESNYK
jgi:hypothetical protein